MDTRARHFGRISARKNGMRTVDVGALVRRLILFEHCFLESSLLREMPSLLQVFGYDGVMRLLDEPGFQIISDAMTAGSIGQNSVVRPTAERGGVLPQFAYNITTVSHAEPDEPFKASLKHVEGPGTSHAQRKRLKERLASQLLQYPRGAGTAGINDFREKLERAPEALMPMLRHVVDSKLGAKSAAGLRLEVEKLDFSGDYGVRTNLSSDFGISAEEAHKLVERALLGMAGLHQRIRLMESLNAVTGFQDREMPMFEAHLDFLMAQIDPGQHEATFDRVVEIGGLPKLDPISPGVTIDVKKLLALRNDPECAELRTWLRTVTTDSEAEIEEQFGSVREKLAAITHGKAAEALRFLATNGLGLIPGVGIALGPASSLGDRYLVEKVIGSPGPVSFLNNSYRSVFND